jgi:hypothetical protein
VAGEYDRDESKPSEIVLKAPPEDLMLAKEQQALKAWRTQGVGLYVFFVRGSKVPIPLSDKADRHGEHLWGATTASGPRLLNF